MPFTAPCRRRLLAWLAGTLFVACALAPLIQTLPTIGSTSPGFKVRGDAAVDFALPKTSSGALHGLQPQDRVVAVEGLPVHTGADVYRLAASRPAGSILTYDIVRYPPLGQRDRLQLRIPSERFGWQDWGTQALPFWLGGVASIALGIFVLALRPLELVARLAFAAFASAGWALLQCVGDLQGFGWPSLADACFLLACMSSSWTAVLFGVVFPLPLFPQHFTAFLRVTGVVWGAATLFCLLANALGLAPWVSHFLPLALIVVGDGTSLVSPTLALARRRASPLQKAQARIIFAGMLLAALPDFGNFLQTLPGIGAWWQVLGGSLFPPALGYVLGPLAVAYAILRHQLFGIELLVKRTLTYSILTVVLSVLYFLAAGAAGPLGGERPGLAGFLTTALIAVAFLPLRNGLQALLERLFFRNGYRFEHVVADFQRGVQTAVGAEPMVQAFVQAVEGALAPGWIEVGLHGGGPAVQPEILLPLKVDGLPPSWVALGPRKSDLTYADLDRLLLNNLAHQLAVGLDLLARRAEAQRQGEEIEALRRTEAMQNQFLALVSHELRTPLSVILGNVSFLGRFGGPFEGASRRHLTSIQESAGELIRFVNDLLDAGQLQAGGFRLDRGPLQLGPVAAEIVSELAGLAEEQGQTLVLHVEASPEVVGDPQRLRQVLRNLVHNAIRYGPPDETVHLGLGPTPDGLRCTVTNGGPGIAPEALGRLFERFGALQPELTDRARQGVGLGLFIAKALVEAHGGAIGVDSDVQRGTTFWFTLPRVAEKSER